MKARKKLGKPKLPAKGVLDSVITALKRSPQPGSTDPTVGRQNYPPAPVKKKKKMPRKPEGSSW